MDSGPEAAMAVPAKRSSAARATIPTIVFRSIEHLLFEVAYPKFSKV
jgi:hypothetical protein